MKVHKLTIEITGFGNDSFIEDRTGETIRILRQLVERIERGGGIVNNLEGLRLTDSNGNSVGEVSVDWDNEDELIFVVGDEVHWNDPDDDLCSKDGVISIIKGETAVLEDGTEVFLSELTPTSM